MLDKRHACMQYAHVGLRPGSKDDLGVFCFARAPQASRSLGINICLNESILNVENTAVKVRIRMRPGLDLLTLGLQIPRRKILNAVTISGFNISFHVSPPRSFKMLDRRLSELETACDGLRHRNYSIFSRFGAQSGLEYS